MTIDGRSANRVALQALNAEPHTSIAFRQVKYLNNIVEQDDRAIKRVSQPMLGFKSFRCASILLVGIELIHMIANDQPSGPGGNLSAAQQFYTLAR